MKTASLLPALLAIVILPASMTATQRPPCKPVTFWGVSGCELLPDRKCPPGYHVRAVGPPSPQMKAARLICVSDKPSPKKRQPKARPKPSPE